MCTAVHLTRHSCIMMLFQVVAASLVANVASASDSRCGSKCNEDIMCGWWKYDGDRNVCTTSDAVINPGGYTPVSDTRTGCSSNYTCLVCPSDESGAYIFFQKQYVHSTLYLSTTCTHLSGSGFYNNTLLATYTKPVTLRESMTIIGKNTLLFGKKIVVTGDNNTITGVTFAPGSNVVVDNVNVSGLRVLDCMQQINAENAILVVSESTLTKSVLHLPAQSNTEFVNSFGLALAHTNGDIHITCDSYNATVPSLVSQQLRSNTFEVTQTNCDPGKDINLTDMLNIYGSMYEVEFYHDGKYVKGNQYLRRTAIQSLYALGVLVAAMLLFNPDIIYIYLFKHRYTNKI